MEIKIEKSLVIVLAIIVLAVIGWFVWVKRAVVPASSAPQTVAQTTPQQASVPSGVTKEISGGDVTVGVTPLVVGGRELRLDVAINTHSVDMSAFDSKKQIVLVGADGKDVLPSNIAVEGSGHHQTLKITFPKVEKPWKLIVRNVGGVPAREFSW